MRAVTVPSPGGPEALVPAQVAQPTLGARDVLIHVAAAGVNGADLAQRAGHYPPPAGAPPWPGLEVSGVVSASGELVEGFDEGDAVCALLPGGGYAERVAVDERLVLPVPHGVAARDAAALPEVVATVWSNVFMFAALQPGETLLVHGGSSGIGSMAIQLATALGSPVIATAGSAEKVAFCESLGAIGVNYREQDFVDAVRERTDGHGADVVLDIVGGEYIARDIAALATEGRIMVIADRGRTPSAFQVGALMAKRGRIWGTTLRARPIEERAAVLASVRENVWPLIEREHVRPIVDSVFPLEEAADAHRRMESSAHMGKILLATPVE
ncbi:NAD(P)H-quinone oxidoreductase [Microbacterium sp. STN6]|uniref:NAD(P)H-quinone oxidoreductase n=1 Tax=Microbacterium sp. STN6 TaxID=2995588 RepID=UPI002260F2B0|nr:NAD(P)H-quinone oxidoreductase [Microbacterium sp. STN6]MCX7522022.1 NAD(P)H-quinone oxidoreductase [Microbacterium sp. STN6]